MKKNMVIIHGGAPTAVINASLYGAVQEAKRHNELGHIYAARNGTGGLLRDDLIELEDIPENMMQLLLHTPGSAIGTSRDQLGPDEYSQMAEILDRRNIRYVLMNGGNGTMDACGKLYQVCRSKGMDVRVMGIPKTIDNDIAVTDHSPGYGSAARYIAQSVQAICADVKGLSIHVSVVEASGRNAGWIAAASALASDYGNLGPDFIYLPERPFDEQQFLENIQNLLLKKKGIVVVASEGLKNREGNPIVPPIFKVGRATYYGDVGSYLANSIIKNLGYKARTEKPGILGRASICMQSSIDRDEAVLAGELACRAVMDGENGKMVAFRRISTDPYKIEPFLTEIEKVMLDERTMPDNFINSEGNGVTEEFKHWCRPLIGDPLPEMISFN